MSIVPVIIESPYAGDVERNLRYLRACMRDSILRGEAPYASHGLYTQPGVLRDDLPEERKLGIEAGFVWRSLARFTAVYVDLGVTQGMRMGIEHALDAGGVVVERSLGANWEIPFLEKREKP